MTIHKSTWGLLALMSSALITACGPTSSTAAPSSSHKALVYFIFTGYAAPYFAPMAQAAKQAAHDYPNLNLKIIDANGSASQEITDIKEAVANNAKGIILNPVNGSVTAAAVQAMHQGVPVVAIDRDVNSPAGRDVFIGDNDKELGYLQTHHALQYLISHHVPTPWHVVILQGTLGSSTAIDRLAGAMTALHPYVADHKVKIVLNQSANFETGTAQTIMSEFLAKDSNVQLVVASNDAMALGALTALKNAGIQAGKTTYVVGADAQPQSLTAVAQGTQLDTVTHSPFVEAYWAVEAMNNILRYHTMPPKRFPHGDVIIPMTLVTSKNVSQIAGWGTPQVVPPLPYGYAQSHKVSNS